MSSVGRLFLLLPGLVWFQGCAVGPSYEPPEPEMPDAWHQALTSGMVDGKVDLRQWWTTLGDPVLDRLMERAVEGNLDLKTALARIDESRAIRGIAAGEYYPVIDATADAVRSRTSVETAPVLPPGVSRNGNFFQTGIGASWEIDVFGRIRRSVESADAGLEATVENFRDLLVVLCAEVAQSYVEVRVLQERIRLAEVNVETQAATLQLTRDRFAAGIVPELDIEQAKLNLSNTKSTIPALRILLVQSIHRLEVLLGDFRVSLEEELSGEVAVPRPPEVINVGLPAELLRRRPDVRRAERQLAAQTAQIGVATADLYPRFSLLGTMALEATQLTNLGNTSSSYTFSLGPSMRWDIFSGGRIRSNISAEDARTRQALLQYEQTVLLALEEVENAMYSFAQEIERRDALADSVAAAQKSAGLVRTLYRAELTDFQNVLDTERFLVVQEDQLADSRGRVTNNLIRIYKALGGGWTVEPETRSEG